MTIKIAIFIALAIISINKQVDCQCADLIQQYYQCKYLKMTNNTSDSYKTYGIGPAYVPDSSIPNNQLTDTFYKGLSLGQMTFDQAMQLFWNIYNETNNCNSKFCDCVSNGLIDQAYSPGSVVFRNATIYPQMKSILLAFMNKYQPYLSPYSQLTSYFYQTQNLPTLNQFCVNYDYSKNRLSYYSNTRSCDSMGSNSLSLRMTSCQWSVFSLNKNLTYSSTYYKSNLTSCSLIPYKNCPTDARRLVLATSWLDLAFLTNLPSNANNLSNYLDTIVAGTDAFVSNVNYTFVSLQALSTFVTISMTDKLIYFTNNAIINPADSTFTLLNSAQLRIDCNVNMTNTQMGFRWVNFTFVSNQSELKNFYLNMSQLYLQKMDLLISNGTIIKDKNGQNWLQFFYYYYAKPFAQYLLIFDFKSSSNMAITPNTLGLSITQPLLQSANGIVKLSSTGTVLNTS